MTLVPLALITSLILVAITKLLVLEERKLAVIRVPVRVERRRK